MHWRCSSVCGPCTKGACENALCSLLTRKVARASMLSKVLPFCLTHTIERPTTSHSNVSTVFRHVFAARRLRQLNEATGITVEHLSRAGRTSLSTLEETAQELDLRDVRPVSYLVALNQLTLSTASAADAAIASEREASEAEQAAADAARELADLVRYDFVCIYSHTRSSPFAFSLMFASNTCHLILMPDHDYEIIPECRFCKQASASRDADSGLLASRQAQTPQLRAIAADCQRSNAIRSRDLAALGATDDVRHAEIVRRSQQLAALETELAALRKVQQSYRGLPPVRGHGVRVVCISRLLPAISSHFASHPCS